MRRTKVVQTEGALREGFERAAELSGEAGEALTTPLLPGLAIPLAKIFE